MSKKVLSICGLCVLLFSSAGVFAAAEAATEKGAAKAGTDMRFDSNIDAWVSGKITAINEQTNKFTIHGTKLPYATAHAEMKKDMQAKTMNLEGAQRDAKIAEIRGEWADKLEKAKNEAPSKPADYTFSLPAKGHIGILEANAIRDDAWLRMDKIGAMAGAPEGKPEERPIPTGARDGDQKNEAQAGMGLKDLRIDEDVLVGYDTGVITNEAYAVVHGFKPAMEKAPAAQPTR